MPWRHQHNLCILQASTLLYIWCRRCHLSLPFWCNIFVPRNCNAWLTCLPDFSLLLSTLWVLVDTSDWLKLTFPTESSLKAEMIAKARRLLKSLICPLVTLQHFKESEVKIFVLIFTWKGVQWFFFHFKVVVLLLRKGCQSLHWSFRKGMCSSAPIIDDLILSKLTCAVSLKSLTFHGADYSLIFKIKVWKTEKPLKYRHWVILSLEDKILVKHPCLVWYAYLELD